MFPPSVSVPCSFCVTHIFVSFSIIFCHFANFRSCLFQWLSVIRESSAGAVLPHHVCCTQKLCVVHRSPPLSDKTQLLSFCAPHLITSGDIFSRVVLPNYVLLPLLPWTDKHNMNNMNINERQVCKEFYQYNVVAPRRRGEITLSPHYQRLIRVIGRGGAEERSLDVDKLRGAVGGELL